MSGDGWLRGPQWASPAAKAEWSDRLEAAAKAWEELEVASITAGLRPSALVFLSPDELVRATADSAAVGLSVVPLSWAGGSLRAAVCEPSLSGAWLAAWRAGDDERIGALLGFPECCRSFFRRTWVEGGWRDTTAGMVTGGIDAAGPAASNILLRRLGVRLVPHLPCSFGCEASARWADAFVDVARCSGIEDVDQILALLSLPMTWSACNGAAVVDVGGILRFSYETDVRPGLIAFRRPGRALSQEPPPWRDNGFASRATMSAAHQVVAAVVGQVESAIDLGAGDGSLLDLISCGRTGDWMAIEAEPGRVDRGQARRPRIKFAHTRIEHMTDVEARDVVILQPGRLLEMDAEDADGVRAALPHRGRRLVVYGYGDTLAEGGLAQLVAWSKIPGRLGPVAAGNGVQAAEVHLA